MSLSDIFRENFHKYDWIILVWTVLTIVCLVSASVMCFRLNRCLSETIIASRANKFRNECIKPSFKANEEQIKRKYFWQETFYTAFINMTSTFPLLGMIGTVWSLLQLSLGDSSDMLMSNFFVALTSTFWGAVGGSVFKFADCFLNPVIEENNENYHMCITRNTLDINSENSIDQAGDADEEKQDIS